MISLSTSCQRTPLAQSSEDRFDEFFKIVKVGNQENAFIKEQLRLFQASGHRIKVSIAAALVDVENSSSYLSRSPQLDELFARWLEIDHWYYSRLRDGDKVCIEPAYVYHYEVYDKKGRFLGELPTWWYYRVDKKDRSINADLEQLPGFPHPQHRYVKQAQQGSAKAQLLLGNDYMDDDLRGSVPKDEAKALYWWERAAQQGEAGAYAKLGQYYLASQPERAVEYFRSGAKRKDTTSALELARCYRRGLGVKADADQVVTWYTFASRHGSPKAAMELGEFYRDGELGLAPNKGLAMQWFRKASSLGVPESLEALDSLSESE